MKSASGKFVLRLPSSLHQSLSMESKKKGLSLNQYCLEILQSRFQRKENNVNQQLPHANKIIAKLREKLGPSFLGIILFGSRALGENTEDSDLDLLIVLHPSAPLNRDLYRWWDGQGFDLSYPVNPHFVHLPDDTASIGSLWLEAASSGSLLLDKGNKLSHFIQKVRNTIDQGLVQRSWSHGHPYWIWKNHEKQIPH